MSPVVSKKMHIIHLVIKSIIFKLIKYEMCGGLLLELLTTYLCVPHSMLDALFSIFLTDEFIDIL